MILLITSPGPKPPDFRINAFCTLSLAERLPVETDRQARYIFIPGIQHIIAEFPAYGGSRIAAEYRHVHGRYLSDNCRNDATDGSSIQGGCYSAFRLAQVVSIAPAIYYLDVEPPNMPVRARFPHRSAAPAGEIRKQNARDFRQFHLTQRNVVQAAVSISNRSA